MERLRRQTFNSPVREETAAVALADLPEPVENGEPYNPDVWVTYGASIQQLPLAGLTASQAWHAASAILQADRRTPGHILVNGMPVSPDYVLAAGDQLEFVHEAGEKG